MSESPFEEFGRRLRHLVFRDGVSTFVPSRELRTDWGLYLEVSADCAVHKVFGGVTFSSMERASDSTGTIYENHTINGNLGEIIMNHERVAFHLPMMRKLMVLDDLASL